MFNNKTKAAIAVLLSVTYATSFAMSTTATGTASTTSTTSSTTTAAKSGFAMKEVKTVDANTLKISFSKDLVENSADMSEFALTAKGDTKEIALTGMTLSSPNELTVKTVTALTQGTEYSLTAVFVSDKEANVIENGVDGTLTFVAAFDGTQGAPDMNAASVDTTSAPVADDITKATVSEELNAAGESTSTGEVSASGANATEVAADAKALPQTGPAEMVIVMLAFILGLAFVVARRKAQ